jgi:ketosteroid isomerase-like protein
MSKFKRTIPLALVIALSGCGSRTSASDDAEKNNVLQAMRDWADGYVMRDPVRLDRARASDWTYSGDPSGAVVTKADADRMFRNDSTKYLSFDYEDLNVRIYGDTAVVIGREKLRWQDGGRTDSGSYRITAVFVKQQNLWRCVASHSSPIVAEK